MRLLLLIALPLVATAQEAKLRYRWTAGAEYHVQSVELDDAIVHNVIKDDRFRNKTENRFGRRYKVVRVLPDGSAELEVGLEYASIRVWQDKGIATTDTRDASRHDTETELLRLLIGKSYRVQLSARGEVVSVSGLESVFDDLREQTEKMHLGKDMQQMMDALIQGIAGEQAARSTVSQMIVPLPEEPLKRGATWTRTLEQPSDINMQWLDYKYRLESDPTGPLRVTATVGNRIKSKLETVDQEMVRFEASLEWVLDATSRFPTEVRYAMHDFFRTYLKDGAKRVPAMEAESRRFIHDSVGPKAPELPPEANDSPAQPRGGHTAPVSAIGFSPDLKRFVSGGEDNTVKIWHLPEPGAPATLTGHAAPIVAVTFTRDGARVLSASEDGVLKIWDAASGRELRSIAVGGRIWKAAFAAGGKRAAVARPSGEAGEIELWDLDAGKKLRTVARPRLRTQFLSLSDDGRRIAASGGGTLPTIATSIDLVDENGAPLPGPRSAPGKARAAAAISPDGKWAFVERREDKGPDTLFEVIDLDKPNTVVSTLSGFADAQAEAVAFSRGGERIVIALPKGIIIWDIKGGRVGQKPGGGARTVALSDDGTVMSWSVDTEINFAELGKH